MSLQSAEAAEVAISAVALDHNSAAHALGLSPSRLREHVRLGELVPHFSGTKPLYLVRDLEQFVQLLPTRPVQLTARVAGRVATTGFLAIQVFDSTGDRTAGRTAIYCS